MTFFYDLNKKLKEVLEQPKSVHKQLNEGAKPDFLDVDKDGNKKESFKKAVADKKKSEVDEGMLDSLKIGMAKAGQAAKAVGKKGLETLGHGSDADMIRDLQKKMGVAQTGEKPRSPIAKEEYGPLESIAGSAASKFAPSMHDKIKNASKEELSSMATNLAGDGFGSSDRWDDEYKLLVQAQRELLGSAQAQNQLWASQRSQGIQNRLDKTLKTKYPNLKVSEEGGGRGGNKEVVDEKWDTETKVSPSEKGKYAGKSKAELQKQYNALKAKGPHKKGSPAFGKMRELAFAIRAKSGWGKVSEEEIEEGWDDMLKDVEKRRGGMKTGEKMQGHKGEIEKTATGIRHTRKYDPKTGETDSGDDEKPAGEKRGRGRPKKTDRAPERVTAKAYKHKGGRVAKEGEEELDEKAVSKAQQKFMGMAHAMQKGEKIPGASKELKKVAKTMKKKDVEDYAATKHKGLPEKVKGKKKEKTEESDVAPTSGKGLQFGKGIYDSLNREIENIIAESMNISMSDSTEGGKSLTVSATEEDAVKLAAVLKLAGVGGSDAAEPCPTCGSADCGCGDVHEEVDENAPDWPTDTVTSDDALQYAGGLNKPKTTVAGNGQTTVPVTAVQVREEEEQYKQDLRKLLESAGIEVTEEMLEEGWKEKLAAAGTAAAVGAAGLGMMGGGQAPQSPSHGLNPDTVSSMGAKFQQNRAEEAQLDQRAQAFSKINKDFSDQYIKLIDQRQADASASDATTAKLYFYTRLEKLLKQYQAMEEGMFEQEQVMAPESIEEAQEMCEVCEAVPCKCDENVAESLARFRSLAGIQEAAKPDYIDLDKDGDKEESMKKAAADKAKEEGKKVDESIFKLTNLWKAYKG